ncbi:MAG: FAD-dependent oxidoreductase, partial [Actinomycetota bacterium]|nr:FAD-dependent oxidoreductase [Actinomycetota bacterium]
AVWMPEDGYLDPHTATYALADGARALGVRIVTRVRVTGIELSPSRAVVAVETERGRIETDVVVNAAGLWAPRVASMVGVRVPSTPVDHQHVAIAAAVGHELPRDMPCFRDPDNLVYGMSEAGGVLFGGYEGDPAARWIDGAPWTHSGTSLPADEARFEPLMRGAIRRFPFLEGAGMVKLVCHPDAMTPDANPLLGPVPGVRGYWMAAGLSLNGFGGAGGMGRMLSQWIVDGGTEWDVSSYRPWRFGRVHEDPAWTAELARETYRYYYLQRYPFDHDEWGRPRRVSALHSRLQEAGAVFGVKHGWERADHLVPGAAWRRAGADQRTYGFSPPPWLSRVGEEHSAVRERAGLFDLSSFGKIEVSGPGALDLLERVSANRVDRPTGRIAYTQFLSPDGGILSDVTITRLAQDRFRVITGAAAIDADIGWLRMHAGDDVDLRDASEELSVIALWGAVAPAVLADADAQGPQALRAATIELAGAEVFAQAISYVGEPGWEFYVEPEWAVQVWDALLRAGRARGIEVCGYRAIDGLRLEAGFRALGIDLTAADDPFASGLGAFVAMDREFNGRKALAARRTPSHRLRTLGLGDGSYVTAYGGEAVMRGDEALGRIRSSAYGYTVGRHLATASLPAEIQQGDRFDVDVFGVRVDAEVLADAPLREA